MKTLSYIVVLLLIVFSVADAQVNYAIYDIDVKLDTKEHTLSGSQKITYINRTAGKPLNVLKVHLFQNAFRGPESTFARNLAESNNYIIHDLKDDERGWMEVENLYVDGAPANFKVDDTIMEIDLPKPIMSGDTINISLDYLWKISKATRRSGRHKDNYSMTQWYPRIVRYEPDIGWHDHQYENNGEFCADFGDYRVSMTIPENFWVGSTGALVHSTGSNTPPTPEEYANRSETESESDNKSFKDKTLVFKAENVRDFAWVASPNYVMTTAEWEGITIRNLFFAGGEDDWGDAAKWGAQTIAFMSEYFGKYPYKQFTITEAHIGISGAMEYPQLITNDPSVAIPLTRLPEMVTVHEIAHTWFPMIMGTNEYEEAWLDEGFAALSEVEYMIKFFPPDGEIMDLPGWFPLDISTNGRHFHENLYLLGLNLETNEPILMSTDDRKEEIAFQTSNYSEAYWVLSMLEYVVGEDKYREIMHTYFDEWKFRHPKTDDFIEVAERVSGMELDWFFDQWLRTTKTCDYALDKIKKHTNSGKHTTEVTFKRKGEIVMPLEIELLFDDGSKQRTRIDGNTLNMTVTFISDSKAKSVSLDPDRRLLDVDRSNNYSGGLPMNLHPLVSFTNTEEYPVNYGPILWHNLEDGYRFGVWFMGAKPGYQPFLPLDTKDKKFLALSYGTKAKTFNWQAEYSTIALFADRARWGVGAWELEGRREVYAMSDFRLYGNQTTWKNRQRIRTRLSRYDVFDSSFGYILNRQSVATTSLTVDWELYSRGWGWRNKINVNLKQANAVASDDSRFTRLYLKNLFSYRKPPSPIKEITLRTYAVSLLSGVLPYREKIDISGASPIAADGFFMINEKGPIREIKSDDIRRFRLTGGPNLRGFWDRYLTADHIVSSNLEVNLPLNIFLFYDVGYAFNLVDEIIPGESSDKTLSDAGFGLKFGPLAFAFPVYVSDPLPGEDTIKFRWNFSLPEWNLPIRF